ncbi:MAG: dienelactone hydrolase family protein, partial [Vulcanimicrobiaceae bacterium]
MIDKIPRIVQSGGDRGQERRSQAVMPNRSQTVEIAPNLPGYMAEPAGPGPAPGVLLFMEAYGVNDYIESEVRRLTGLGYVAIAPDFFRGETFAYSDGARAMARVVSLSDDELLADVRATIAFLDRHPGVRHDRYGAVGFCMG